MDLLEKLEILADAAKYDVACTSSGVDRDAQKGKLGNTLTAGCCHSFSADGRCITLLKVLMTNVCVYDCAYCVNRVSNEVRRAAFKPRELADLTISFYRRNYIEGLFLSSGVARNPDYTTELMIQTLAILRDEYEFRGYIHAKAVPGTSPELIDRLGHLADRLSVNMELPSQESLSLLAPQKSKQQIVAPMRQISDHIAQDKEERALARRSTMYMKPTRTARKERAFAPAGQSTQMIIGATPESDYQILTLASALYQTMALKRVFFSAYLPVNDDARLPGSDDIGARLNREHRLYQADWLLRFYRFGVDEIIDPDHPFLDADVDPKTSWALNHLEFFPVEVNTAPYEHLLRVPGIGVKGAHAILKARRTATLREAELRKLGIAYKRARFFITCNGVYEGNGLDGTRESLRAQLAAPIEGGAHGRRAGKVAPGQMSLFDEAAAAGEPFAPAGCPHTLAPAGAAAVGAADAGVATAGASRALALTGAAAAGASSDGTDTGTAAMRIPLDVASAGMPSPGASDSHARAGAGAAPAGRQLALEDVQEALS